MRPWCPGRDSNPKRCSIRPSYIWLPSGGAVCVYLAWPFLPDQPFPCSDATWVIVVIALSYLSRLFVSLAHRQETLSPVATDSQRGSLSGGVSQFDCTVVLRNPPNLLRGGEYRPPTYSPYGTASPPHLQGGHLGSHRIDRPPRGVVILLKLRYRAFLQGYRPS